MRAFPQARRHSLVLLHRKLFAGGMIAIHPLMNERMAAIIERDSL